MRLFLVLALAVTACVPDPVPIQTTMTTSTPPTTTVDPVVEEPGCFGVGPGFGEAGVIGSFGSSSTDATVLTGLRWQSDAECDRVFLDFATQEGAPALDAPAMEVNLFRQIGVLRVSFGDEIQTASFAEQRIETGLMSSAFVVRGTDTRLYLDIHLTEPALAHIVLATSPARATITLRAGGSAIGVPVREDDIILFPPPSSSYPFELRGYTRAATEALEVRLISVLDGSTYLFESPVEGEPDTWHEFTIPVTEGPPGMVLVEIRERVMLELEPA